MLPLILISQSTEKIDNYISEHIKNEGYSPFNIFPVHPLKSELTINQIREVKKQIIDSVGSQRLFILYSFDNATLEAQNALLKTLEEQNGVNDFILVASMEERILPTIRSRSKINHLDSVQERSITIRSETRELLTLIEQSNSYEFLAHKLVQSPNKEELPLLFDEIVFFMRERLKQNFRYATLVIKKTLEKK